MTKDEAKDIVVKYFRDNSKPGIDTFILSKEYKEAERVLGGRLSPEMKAIYESVGNDESV